MTRLKAKRKTIRSAFIYGAVTAVVLTCLGMYSLLASLTIWQTLLLLSGSLIVIWTILFTVLEMLRLAKQSNSGGNQAVIEDEDLEFPRVVVVHPATGDPYPHHEHYAESGGLDQGQLTSQLPESAPLFIELIRRRRRNKRRVS